MNVKAKGYILGAIAAASYGMNPLFTLPLYKEGMDPDSVFIFQVSVRYSHHGNHDQVEKKKLQNQEERNPSACRHGYSDGAFIADAFPEL